MAKQYILSKPRVSYESLQQVNRPSDAIMSDDENITEWLARHGIVLYGNYNVPQQSNIMTNHVYHHNEFNFRQYAIDMALNSPVPHPWCWFCQNFGRLNCFFFHILQQRSDTNGAAVREPGQVPLYLRQSARNCQPTSVVSNARPPPPQPPVTSNVEQSQEPPPNKRRTKIAYYEIEIRPNVKNIPPNLNRFIPYRVPIDPSEDSSTDSCPSPISDSSEILSPKAIWDVGPSDSNSDQN